MSKRETHFYHISTSSKAFETFDAAVGLANNLNKNLHDFLKRNKDYACLIYISVSQSSDKTGCVKAGYRGKKIYVADEKLKQVKVNPHIHIFVLAHPGEEVAKQIYKYIRKNITETIYRKNADDYWWNVIPYDVKQALKSRTCVQNLDFFPEEQIDYIFDMFENINVNCCEGTKPLFKDISNKHFEKYRFTNNKYTNEVFTNFENQNTENPLILRDFEATLEDTNNYNVIYSNNKYNNLYNLYNLYNLVHNNKSYVPDNSNNPTIFITNHLQTHLSNTS